MDIRRRLAANTIVRIALGNFCKKTRGGVAMNQAFVSEFVASLRDDFVSYYEAPYSLRSITLETDRHAALTEPGFLVQDPLIEPVLRYPSSAETLSEIAGDRLASFLE